MSTQSIEKFKEYLENQNKDFLQDGRRVEGIIRDIFPEEKALIPLLTCAWKAGVVAGLRQSTNVEGMIAQFSDRLCQEYGLKESSALTAVSVWAYALGLTDDAPNINISTSFSISQPRITTEMKKCPFCAEEIKKDARKCKHCQSDISDNTVINEAQSNELINQRESLERERHDIEREKNEAQKNVPNINKNKSKGWLWVIISVIVAIIAYAAMNNKEVKVPETGVPNAHTNETINTATANPKGSSVQQFATRQEVATQVCPESSRIFKECYMKAASGISLAQAINDIKSEIVEAHGIAAICGDSFAAHGRMGGVSSSEIDKMSSTVYSECLRLFSDGIAKSHIKNVYVAAQNYFGNEPEGVLTEEKLKRYGYESSAAVKITIINGTFNNLSISAKHKDNNVVCLINSAGDITEMK